MSTPINQEAIELLEKLGFFEIFDADYEQLLPLSYINCQSQSGGVKINVNQEFTLDVGTSDSIDIVTVDVIVVLYIPNADDTLCSHLTGNATVTLYGQRGNIQIPLSQYQTQLGCLV